MNHHIKKKEFSEIDINDCFFQSLKDDYPGFEQWFSKKAKKGETAFVLYNDYNTLDGFLYLKIEKDIVTDVVPNILADSILKVGTFKINAHGTKLGEQFIKIILDYAVASSVNLCYVTIFPKHNSLIKLVEKFGFEFYGTKGLSSNKENVYVKKLNSLTGNILKDFPLVDSRNKNKYILGIYPKYHTIMFPDSILTTENKDIIKDVSYTNSIHKIYVCGMRNVENLKYGDILVVYRTAENNKSAEYNSVATSICVVEEVRQQNEFVDFEDFYNYAKQYTVFDKNELFEYYKYGNLKAIKMTYNIALSKRLTRSTLINEVNIPREGYWGFKEISDLQFNRIINLSKVNPNLII